MNLNQLRTILQEEKIIFSFSGTVTQSLVVGIAKSMKHELEKRGEENSIIDSIFSIVVEQLQNIMSYSQEKESQDSKGILLLGFSEEKNKYFSITSNQIKEDDKKKIITKIELLNAMSAKEKRKYLRDLLKSGEFSHAKGAGVGFVEISKRASENLLINFNEFDNSEYFELKVYV